MKIGYKNLLRRRTDRRRGFALLITIVLVAFLVLLLVGLATFTRVETQVADNSQQLAAARQNALMAMNLALGRLQATTGPDQRVTATADLQPRTAANAASTTDVASGQSLTGATNTVLNNIDGFWRGSRNRRWVGVWKDGNTDPIVPANPLPANPDPELQAWLVSGNETVANTFSPTDTVAGLTFAAVDASNAAQAPINGAGGTYRLLVGKNTANITAAAELDRAVVAPQIPITAPAVPGLSGPQTVGHYAWWVGDEGVKAKVSVIDAYATAPTAEDERTRLQSAQRPAIEAISPALDAIYPENDSRLSSLLSFEQLGFLTGNTGDLAVYRPRYHDLTLHSRGVLADTRRGGLKADLSWLLGQSNATDFRDDLRDLFSDNTIVADDPILDPAFTPYVDAPGNGVFAGANFAGGLSRTATWSQLRSYFHLGSTPAATPAGVIDAGVAQARIQTASTQGIGPLLVHGKVFFGLSVDATGNISVQIRPLIVLANPYSIPIAGNFWARFNRPDVQLRSGNFSATPVPPAPTDADLPSFPTSTAVNYDGRLILSLPNVTIPPGEARVYCLARDYSDTGSGAVQISEMAEGYNDVFKYTQFVRALPAGETHAALYIGAGVASARLYATNPAAIAFDDQIYQYIYGRPLNAAGGANFFVVYPVAAGAQSSGGGCWFVMQDSVTTSPNTAQQASFVQYNPRNLVSFWTASSGVVHPTEQTQSYQRNGAAGNDAWLTSDLMFDIPGDKVRWGPITKADASGSPRTTPPAGISDDTGFFNILYDLPRPGHPVASLGQLQHFSPSGFISGGRFGSSTAEQYAVLANTFQINYPVGNSYANPRLARDRVIYAATTASGSTNMGVAYDGSWLLNEVLADRFYFSSYPATGNFDFATDKLVNDRIRPFRDRVSAPWDDEASFRDSPRQAAKNLLVNGAFNINSTSVEAWKAVLSSLRKVPVDGDATVNVPFARTLYQPEGYTAARNGNSKDAWAGFSNLSDVEIDSLAREIVLQIRRRGPALSLADFINRRLTTTAAGNDPMDLGLSGALQSAIDAVMNAATDVDPALRVQSLTSNMADTAHRLRTMTAGAPGYLLQGDLLSPLAPTLAARSDTFVIRTYGDAYNPALGTTNGQAWCEAVVQRLPDYIDSSMPAETDLATAPASAARTTNQTFGRRYQVISFRWLSPDDI